MRILFLSAWFPYPANNGSKLRIYNLLRGLAQQHEVSLISFADPGVTEAPAALKKVCKEVRIVPARQYNAHSLRAMLGFFSQKPRVLVDRYVPEMAAAIREEIRRQPYDLVIASQWYTADYYDPSWGIPAIFEEAEIGIFDDKVAHAATGLQRLRHRLTNVKMRTYFRRRLSEFYACTVASATEKDLLHSMAPEYNNVVVIPNGVNLEDYARVLETPQPDRLIFTGSFSFFANYEAMRWFVEHVFRRIQAQIPGVHLTITGDPAGKTLPQAQNVALAGFVRDVRPLIAGSWASLAPIQTGGGTRLKILEAMALHTPVIATSKGAQGLEATHGEHLLIADTPEDFAEATVSLLKDPGLRRKLASNAYHLVSEKYDWPVIWPRLWDLVDQAARSLPGKQSETGVDLGPSSVG